MKVIIIISGRQLSWIKCFFNNNKSTNQKLKKKTRSKKCPNMYKNMHTHTKIPSFFNFTSIHIHSGNIRHIFNIGLLSTVDIGKIIQSHLQIIVLLQLHVNTIILYKNKTKFKKRSVSNTYLKCSTKKHRLVLFLPSVLEVVSTSQWLLSPVKHKPG